jgi:hypothetical protein
LFFKNNETEHVSNEEKFRTTMPQEPTELTIDNTQLSSNRDIGMNVRYIWIMSIPACSGVYIYQRKPQKRPLGKEYVKCKFGVDLLQLVLRQPKRQLQPP